MGIQVRKWCLKIDAIRRREFWEFCRCGTILPLLTHLLLNSRHRYVFHVDGEDGTWRLTKLIEDPRLQFLRNSSYSHHTWACPPSLRQHRHVKGWRESFGTKELDSRLQFVYWCLIAFGGCIQGNLQSENSEQPHHQLLNLLNRASWSRRKEEIPDGIIVDGWVRQSKYLS